MPQLCNRFISTLTASAGALVARSLSVTWLYFYFAGLVRCLLSHQANKTKNTISSGTLRIREFHKVEDFFG